MNTYDFLETIDVSKRGIWFKVLLAPIWLLFEYINFKKYWKIILTEIIENDKIIEFLDKNDFGLVNNRIVKKELVSAHEHLQGRKLEEIRLMIHKEYVTEFSKIISENCQLNIEDLLSLSVNVDIHISETNGEIFKNPIYEVIIQYCRYWWVLKSRNYTIIWLLSVLVLSFSLYFIITSVF